MPTRTSSRTPSRWAGLSAADRRVERRALLLDAAFELLGTEGSAATTVRSVCARARLNPRYFYESFSGLDELVVAVYDRLVEQLTAAVVTTMDDAPTDPSSQTRAAIEQIVGFVDEDRRRGRVLYAEALDNEALNRRRFETGHTLAEVVAQDAAARFGPPPPGEEIGRVGAAILVGGFSELLVAWLQGRIDIPREQLVDDAVALFTALGRTAAAIAARRGGIIGSGPAGAPGGGHMREADPLTSSPFVAAIEPITGSDDEIARALEDAEVPPLLPALAYLTGDLSLLRDDLRPDPLLAAALPQGGFSDDQLATARRLALETLVRFRDGGCVPAPPPTDADLLRIMEHTVGETGLSAYLPLLSEELGVRDRDHRAPDWHRDDLAPGSDLRVVVIGAGMSGILAAHRLQQAGIPFVVVEKDDDVGGTWLENTYPGCRVDNPNHNYSYSFAQRHDWPFHFSTQGVLHDYFRDCADAFGVLEHVRFGTEVLSATWSDDDRRWTVCTRDANGKEDLVADVVISAVGQLNRPSYPDIEGIDSFAGEAFHSARWDHSVDLTGKRVAVIGTGASAVQFVPEIASAAGHLTLFQRTPPWLGPTPEYHDSVAPGLRWLYGHVPSYSEWNRFWIFWRMGDAALDAVRVDPDWDRANGSVSGTNEFLRVMLTAYLEGEFADRPDLLPHVVPQYPPGGKRLLRDNGVWARTLKRDDVALVTERIERITPTGVVTADGTEHPADVIVYGTGFAASKFLTPMTVRGRGGLDLHEHWAGDARAYLGITVPGFPNLFCLYGPNTNIVINGSIIYFSECGVRYVLGCLRHLLASGNRALDVRTDVHDAFNASVDDANRMMSWGASDVNSWYKNDSGRVSQNWPFTLLEYWQRTLAPDPAEYELLD